MTSGQKIAFSLLAALCLFAGLVLSLNSRLFKELETRFYTQAKIEENTGQLDKISESCDSYISEILSLVEKGENAWTKNAAVRSYYVQNPSESDINTRRRLTEQLFTDIPALTGIRIVDKNGRNVHYSSFDETDLLSQNGLSKVYKNYNDITRDSEEIDFEQLKALSDENKSVLLCDDARSRFILSVPFCWIDGIYSGQALFYLNVREVEKALAALDLISIGQGMTLIAGDDMSGGLVLNLPYGEKKSFAEPLKKYWKSNTNWKQPEKILALPDGRFYVALSSRNTGKIRVTAIYTSDMFELSTEVRVLIYVCIFISILLIVFLFFSLFTDPVTTLQKRVKKIQLEIIQNYLDEKDKKEWSDVARQLRLRKNDLSDDIIKSLRVHSKKRRKELSDYLDKNWNEIFTIFDTKSEGGSSGGNANASGAAAGAAVAGAAELTGASIAEIRRMLEEVLQNRTLAATPVKQVVKAADEVEDLDDADEVEEVEELAEDVDEVEDLDDAEEVEELAEDVEEAEDVDEVEELAEDVEDAEDVDEVEDLNDAEEVEELAEDADEVEDAEDVDEVEDLDDADDVEDLDDADDVEELEAAYDDSDFLASLLPPPPEYIPSDETFFASDEFADVDNLYAEELCLGERCIQINTKPIPVTVYQLPEYQGGETETVDEPVEETIEESLDEPVAEAPVEETADEVIESVEEPAVETVDEPVEEPAETPEDSEELFASVEDTIDVDVIEDSENPILSPVSEAPVEEEEPAALEEEPEMLDEPVFSMAGFADNVSETTPELEAALAVPTAPENTIVEKDGVFTISENLEYTNVVQDEDFKELVDSIL